MDQCLLSVWLLLLVSTRIGAGVAQETSSTLGDFVKQLTSLITANGGIGNLVNAVRPPGGYPGQVLAGGEDGYGLYPEGPYGPQYPGDPPQYPGYAPQYPGYDPYRPQHPGYPQQSFMAALDSITRYDDLRCVPRLLCEVTSGGKPGYPSSSATGQQQTAKDTITTLLTVLNFMDNNPLLVFGRAALLGAASRGNSAACLNAYPTCPRDPDRLVHYLNNHNGGFFRFFGGTQGRAEDSGEARIQNKPGRALRPADPQDYLPPSAHSQDLFGPTGGRQDRVVFPEDSPGRGGKQLFFPERATTSRPPLYSGSAYKPDFSPPQNLINFRDQRSVKFPDVGVMSFPKA